MRTKPDLIRDILLFVESNTDMTHFVSAKELNNYLRSYDTNEIQYHIRYLSEAHYLKVDQEVDIDDSYAVIDLTPLGHDFIEKVRDNKIWGEVKIISKNIGIYSLDILKQIAVNVITKIITNQ